LNDHEFCKQGLLLFRIYAMSRLWYNVQLWHGNRFMNWCDCFTLCFKRCIISVTYHGCRGVTHCIGRPRTYRHRFTHHTTCNASNTLRKRVTRTWNNKVPLCWQNQASFHFHVDGAESFSRNKRGNIASFFSDATVV